MKQTRSHLSFALKITSFLLLFGLLAACKAPVDEPHLTPSSPEAADTTPAPAIETTVSVETPAPTATPEPAVEIGGQRFDPHAVSVTLSLGSAEEVSEALALFDRLEAVTLVAPVLTPDEYRALSERFPGIALHCGIRLGEQTAAADCTELDLSTYGDWADVLTLFPALRTLELGEVSPLAVLNARSASEDLDVTFRFCGQTVSGMTTELDLSNAPVPTAAELDALLALAPQLETVRIADPDEAALNELIVFNPREKGVDVPCAVTVLGETFDTGTEVMDFGARKVTDEETLEIERVLPVMTRLNEIDLYEAKLSQETMDRLFDGYPDIFFGWTFGIWNDFYTVRSDATAFSSFIGLPGSHRWLLTEDDFRILRYCKGLKALDLGHCGIRNLEFLRNWPHLRILILADTPLTDLSVIAELQDLEYLELFLTTPESYEPLTHLPHLIDLNLCNTRKEGKQYRSDEEIMLLTQIKTLERLWISKALTPEQIQMLRDNLPGVKFDFYSTGSTNNGWREHPRYFIMHKCFETREYRPFS